MKRVVPRVAFPAPLAASRSFYEAIGNDVRARLANAK